jgi:ligand-binding sensor domain-containing protein/signal transduction histidine kinase
MSLLVSMTVPLLAQPKQQYLFYHLGSRNGLVSNEVMCVEQDPKGFIWIGTLNGLQRYDGRRFLSFNHVPGDPFSIPNDGVHSMYMDKKGRLWMKLGENRMGYMNTSDFRFHETPVAYPELPLRDAESRFAKDNEDNMILILDRKAALTYNEAAGIFDSKYNPFQLPAKWAPQGIFQDRVNNNYWISCDSGLVKYSTKEKLMSYRGHNITHDPIIDVYANLIHTSLPYWDNSGRFWLLSWPASSPAHFYSYTIATKELVDWDPNLGDITKGYHETYAVTEEKDGTLWVYGGGIFARLNEEKKTFELVESNLPGEFSIRYDGVRNVFEDREHNLWVSSNKGLYRFNPTGQFLHTMPNMRINEDKKYAADVSDILQLSNGDIVTATWGFSLFAYDKDFNPVKRDYVDQGRALGEGLTWCIHQRANGDIWRGNQDGYLFIYHANKKQTEKLRPPIFGGWTIRQIAEDRDGNLWFGTQGGHIIKWNATTDSFSLVQRFGSIIHRLYTDRQGDIWACSRSHGVFHISSRDGRILHNYNAAGPKGCRLMLTTSSDIIQFDDSLYIVASGGLNIINVRNNTIRYITSDDGLPSNTIVNIIKDKHDRLWLTLESGLCTINMKTRIVSTYNENDGLPTINFNVAAGCVLKDGRIALGASHEMTVFDPEQALQIDLRPPDVVITGFVLMNKWLLMDSLQRLPRISLKPTDNSIVIEFSTLTFQNMYGVSYMLEGLDKEWIRKASNQNQAVYSYLPPGSYTFKVRCENGEGVYSTKITQLKIKVAPPFWQSWWFFCLLALVIAAIVFWLDKQRISRMVALQKVRSEIAGNLHDEVNTTLNNINLLSEMARIKADKDIDRSKEYISEISTKSHNMILAMDDILWSIDPDNDSMEKSLLRMTELGDVLKNLYGANIEIALDKKVRTLKLDMKTRHEVFLLFKQSLQAIVEYAAGRKTLVDIDLFKNKLSIKLHDATATLDKNTEEIDQLVKEMYSRAAYIGADIDVQSGEAGVTIILLIPVK